MRIVYVANARMPTEKAHGLQIMEMCRAFALNGHEVKLVVPRRKNPIDRSVWEYYGLEKNFELVTVAMPDFIVWDRFLGDLALFIGAVWFALAARRIIRELKPDIIYSRDLPVLAAAGPAAPRVFEAHTLPGRTLPFYRWMWPKCDRIVAVTAALKRAFVERGVAAERVVVAPDAADPEEFRVSASKTEARKSLGLPTDGFLAVYSGQLYSRYGLDDLIEAAARLKPGVSLLFVGGNPADLEKAQALAAGKGLGNVIFAGRVPHGDLPLYLHAADLALMAYTGENSHLANYASPMKLFEYQAAGLPVVATDLPSIREALNGESALFVPPKNPAVMAKAIESLSDDRPRLESMSRATAKLAESRTWRNRALEVIAGLGPAPGPVGSFMEKYRLEIRLALLALAVRLAYVLFFPQAPVSNDPLYYLDIADTLRGKTIPGFTAPAFYQFGFPLFLAALRSVFGESLVWLRIVQCFVSAATVFMAMLIAGRWVGGRSARFVGWIGVFYAPMVLDSAVFGVETSMAFFLTLGVLSLVPAMTEGKARRYLLSGAAFAVAGAFREIGFYAGFALAALAAFWKKHFRLVAVFLLPIALVIGASAIRNRIVYLANNGNFAVAPLVSKGYEQKVFDTDFRQTLIRQAKYFPEGLYLYFAVPYHISDLGQGLPLKQMIASGDWAGIRMIWPEAAAKIVLTGFHWLLLALALWGLFKGRMSREARYVLATVVFLMALAPIVGGLGHSKLFAAYGLMSRYRFQTEPLILVLAAAGAGSLAARFGRKKS